MEGTVACELLLNWKNGLMAHGDYSRTQDARDKDQIAARSAMGADS
jgi:hypothetical protein